MAPRNKQSERNQAKKESNQAARGQDDEPAGPPDNGEIMESVKSMVRESCLGQHAADLVPMVKQLSEGGFKKAAPPPKSRDVDANKENDDANEDENKTNEATDDASKESKVAGGSENDLFQSFQRRLSWHNALGLHNSEEASKAAWRNMKEMEVDWGPRSKRRGNPGIDRVKVNFHNNMAQYAHILLALMCLRAFFVRSYFACLPWLFFYQFASLALPLDKIEQIPQIPLDQVPLVVRVLGTAGIHALMVLFFVYELVWCTYFFEKIPLIGLLCYHAYAVRPVGQ